MVLSDTVCRICLDDNHNNVVLTCAKTILSAISCDVNNTFFDLSEVWFYLSKDVFKKYWSRVRLIFVTCNFSFFRKHQLIQGMFVLLLYSEVNQMLMMVFFVGAFGSITLSLPIFFVLARNWRTTKMKVSTLFRMM